MMMFINQQSFFLIFAFKIVFGKFPCEQLLTFQDTGSKYQIQGTLKMLLDAEETGLYHITIETDTEVSQFNDQFKAAAEKNGTVFNLKVESKVIQSEDHPSAKSVIEMFLDIRFRDKITDGRYGIISIKLNGKEQCVFIFDEVISVKSFTLSPTPKLTTPTELTPRDETFEEILTDDAVDSKSDDLNEDVLVDEEISQRFARLEIGEHTPTPTPSTHHPHVSREWNKDGLITIIITVVSAIVGVTIISILIGVFCRRNSSVEGNPRNEMKTIGNQEPVIIHPENIQKLRNSFIYDDD